MRGIYLYSLEDQTASEARRTATFRRPAASWSGSSGAIRIWRWETSPSAPSPRPCRWSLLAALSGSVTVRSVFPRRSASFCRWLLLLLLLWIHPLHLLLFSWMLWLPPRLINYHSKGEERGGVFCWSLEMQMKNLIRLDDDGYFFHCCASPFKYISSRERGRAINLYQFK